ncbi:MAG: GTP 3',8-cyclase MoaA [Anaerolineaceae bacterium]
MSFDLYGRNVDYLRISVTDRCNYRCVYCMPAVGVEFQPHEFIMRYEEIIQVVKAAIQFGVRKVRITGGEPLVRPGIVDFVSMLRALPEIEDISMTTNGSLLTKYVADLKSAGLSRLNVSLDTLKPDLFSKITRGGDIKKVWEGIQKAQEVGLSPVKINAVVVHGLNDYVINDFAKLTIDHPWHVRFIELMPVRNQVPWGEGFPDPKDGYFSTTQMMDRLSNLGLVPAEEWVGNGPAKIYQIPGAKGFVGFISPLEEEHFCKRCNRMRLTADGNLRPCLMSDYEIPILADMRAGKDITALYEQAILLKPKKHELLLHHEPVKRTMMQIGG